MSRLALVLLVALLAAVSSSVTSATPGMPSTTDSLASSTLVNPLSGTSLQPFYTYTGRIYCSQNAAGSLSTSYTIDIEKPSAAATVREAFLMAATVPSNAIANPANAIQLEGNTVPLGDEIISNFGARNYRGDAKAAVQATLNAAPAGIVTLSATDLPPISGGLLDGIILVVIWDEPSASPTTVILLYGAQNTNGDTFAVTFGGPIGDLTNKEVDFALGISFGFQGTNDLNFQQSSLVDVNGQRLTSTAGGNDDGDYANGALITVGGLGDSNNNPPSPNVQVDIDDELYSLKPFLQPTDTGLLVFTENPSNNDNILFASFKLTNVAAIVGQGIVLGPLSAVNPLGTTHTVTATVKDANNNPVVGTQVDFAITAGPNAGKSFSALTDGNGQASWTYLGDGGLGTDIITATFTDSQQQVQTSNQVSKTWEDPVDCNNIVTCMPSFETGSAANCQYNVANLFCLLLSPFQVRDDNSQEVCWKVQSGEVDWKTAAYWPASHGDKSVDLNGRSIGHLVSKVYDLEAGDYQLSFDLGGNIFRPFDKTVKAQILAAGNLAVIAEGDFTHVQTAAMTYNRQTLAFTLNAAASVRIGFLSTTDVPPLNHYGPVIDRVDLRHAQCPPA